LKMPGDQASITFGKSPANETNARNRQHFRPPIRFGRTAARTVRRPSAKERCSPERHARFRQLGNAIFQYRKVFLTDREIDVPAGWTLPPAGKTHPRKPQNSRRNDPRTSPPLANTPKTPRKTTIDIVEKFEIPEKLGLIPAPDPNRSERTSNGEKRRENQPSSRRQKGPQIPANDKKRYHYPNDQATSLFDRAPTG